MQIASFKSTVTSITKNAKEQQLKYYVNLNHLLLWGIPVVPEQFKVQYTLQRFETSDPSGTMSQRSNYIKLLKIETESEPQFLQNKLKKTHKNKVFYSSLSILAKSRNFS